MRQLDISTSQEACALRRTTKSALICQCHASRPDVPKTHTRSTHGIASLVCQVLIDSHAFPQKRRLPATSPTCCSLNNFWKSAPAFHACTSTASTAHGATANFQCKKESCIEVSESSVEACIQPRTQRSTKLHVVGREHSHGCLPAQGVVTFAVQQSKLTARKRAMQQQKVILSFINFVKRARD